MNYVIVILLIIFAAMIKGRSMGLGNREPAAAEPIAKVIAVPSTIAALPTKVAQAPAPAAATPVITVTPKIEVKPEPYAKELADFGALKKKVFLTPAEEANRNQLLSNERVLRGLRGRLMRSPTTSNEALEQNAAIDMLLEAVRVGDSEVAMDVLRTVVTDGQVEDESVDRSTRENLAGIKAEVLFQWSALKPAQASELASLLPGPVSEKIWQNVVDAQQSNLSESAALAH